MTYSVGPTPITKYKQYSREQYCIHRITRTQSKLDDASDIMILNKWQCVHKKKPTLCYRYKIKLRNAYATMRYFVVFFLMHLRSMFNLQVCLPIVNSIFLIKYQVPQLLIHGARIFSVYKSKKCFPFILKIRFL